jgi:hypothetical protein
MSFKKNNYEIIRQAISKELANFICNYFTLNKNVTRFLLSKGYIQSGNPLFGNWNDPDIPYSFCKYGDHAMETLLMQMLPIMIKTTGVKLHPTYSYARIYKKGDILERHKDRASCKISTTLFLGGDQWDIYLEPSGKKNKKGIKIVLNQGDMLIYKGQDMEHWRNRFKGNICTQVFLHYNNITDKQNKLDQRQMLGLPPTKKVIFH